MVAEHLEDPLSSTPGDSSFPASSKKHGKRMRLPEGFVPGKYSVLCGRGSKCTKSTGNRNLKRLVHSYLKPYSEAKNKVEKTSIVSAIIASVKQSSPDGSFVKYEDGAWWEVEDAFAREKIGCLFRDCLHTQYKSSTKAKLARKKALVEPLPMNDMGGSSVVHSGMHSSLNNGFMGMGNMGSGSMGMDPNGANFMNSTFQNEESPLGGFQEQTSMNPFGNTNSNNNVSMDQQPMNHLPMSISSDMGMGGLPMKGKDFKASAVMSDYFGSNNNARPLREDFMSDCLPMNQSSGNNDMMMSPNPLRQPAQFMLGGGARPSQGSSLLRAACNIVGDAPGAMDSAADDDLPDDISDIFDEEDDEPSNGMMMGGFNNSNNNPMSMNPNFSFQNTFAL